MNACRAVLTFVLCGVIACDANSDWETRSLPDDVGELGLSDHVWTSDVWEVVRCRIPPGITDPVYAETERRLSASVASLIAAIEPVSEYFARWSNGRYRPMFVPGSDVVLEVDDSAQTCVDQALDSSSDRATGIIAIADAPHREDRAGGWTQPGRRCPDGRSPCAARLSRRGVYLGASDFWVLDDDSASQSPVPLDLVEHEMGHAFGWPHSSRGAPGAYDSSIDVMSDSAAPRRAVGETRDAPGVLALHRLGAGWLDARQVKVLEPGTGIIRLVLDGASSPSLTDGIAVIIVQVADHVALTIEVVRAVGDNAHLARSGVAVHKWEWGPTICPQSDGLCLGVNRRVTLLARTDDGLLGVGESIDAEGVRIEVTALESIAGAPSAGTPSAERADRMVARVALKG